MKNAAPPNRPRWSKLADGPTDWRTHWQVTWAEHARLVGRIQLALAVAVLVGCLAYWYVSR